MADKKNKYFDRIFAADKELSKLLFGDFSKMLSEDTKRREKAVLLLYIWQSIIDDQPLSVTMQEYEWAETYSKPKVDYKEVGKLMCIETLEMPEKTLFIRKRLCPAIDLPVNELRSKAAYAIQKMIEEL